MDLRAADTVAHPPASARPEQHFFAKGLTGTEAEILLGRFGPNELPEDRANSGLVAVVRDTLKEPMFLLLIAAATIYALVGSAGEATIIGLFALISVGLVIFQRRRGDRALAALSELAAPTARVVREWETRHIPARDVVPGDCLVLGEGERISADAELISSEGLLVDESIVTGESVSVSKQVGGAAGMLLAGSLVVSGHGFAQVTRTGTVSHIGRIGSSLAGIEKDNTVTRRRIEGLVKIFGVLAVVLSSALILLQVMTGSDWTSALLAGIALAMALLPEEFPVVLMIFLTLGAMRMARIDVLVRRSAAIETLGAATVLCVDKTGTLTENRMRLAAVFEAGGLMKEDFAASSTVCCARDATKAGSIDPIDRAVLALSGAAANPLPNRFIPFTAMKPATAAAFDEHGSFRIVAKGAPEFILTHCSLTEAERTKHHDTLEILGEQGFRVLAVAEATHVSTLRQDLFEHPLVFQGFLLFEDPLRASVPAAVREAHAAGVKVIMITGDYPATARAIAEQAGIDGVHGLMTGNDLIVLDDNALRSRLPEVRIFARVQPEQKLRIVQAYAAMGEVVAMTGDGVNDAPALKAAHIGIAIGPRGSDVAREAADLVLLKDDFGLIVQAIRQGRRIFDNLRKVMVYVTAIHVVIAGLVFLPVLLGMPIILWPVHVAMTEMVIDPLCSLGFESEREEANVMRRPPRPISNPVIGLTQLVFGAAQGLSLLLTCLALFWLAMAQGVEEATARTMSFITLTTGNLLLVLVNSTFGAAWGRLFTRAHGIYWSLAGVVMLILSFLVFTPDLRVLLRFGAVSLEQFSLALLLGFAAAGMLELVKLFAKPSTLNPA